MRGTISFLLAFLLSAVCAAIVHGQSAAFATITGASTHGPLDNMACKDSAGNVGPCGGAFSNAIPVEFQFISGNFGRNLGLTSSFYRFDVSVTKAFKLPKWESSSLECKLEVPSEPLLGGLPPNSGNSHLQS